MDWHSLEINEIFSKLKTAKSGLSFDEAKKRLEKYGPNKLPEEKKLTKIKIFFNQFKSPLIYILLIAAAVTISLREFVDTVVILATVFLNTIIGFFEENKAEKAIERLRSALRYGARILRGGQDRQAGAEELVPGDILLLEAGDKVAADARVIEAKNLQAVEAALTGESSPSSKLPGTLDRGAVLADRENMVYMGTAVVRGRGTAVVVATGKKTELGMIAESIGTIAEEQTPLQKQLGNFGKLLAVWFFIIGLGLLSVGFMQGRSFSEMFLMVAAVAVASVPEGLTITMTIILTVGMQRILKAKALVRKLISAETLGSVSIICSDKTGTITLGRMMIDHIFTESDSEKTKAKVIKIGLLCNNVIVENSGDELGDWIISGDPLDQALFLAAVQSGLDKSETDKENARIDEIPFDEERKYMATLHGSAGNVSSQALTINIKGAPEKIIAMSDAVEADGQTEKLTPEKADKFKKEIDKLAGRGLRLVAVAYKNIKNKEDFSENNLHGLTLVGLVAFKDPIRPDAKKAIKTCFDAGIRPILVTGDHRFTAQAIAREIGLPSEDKNILQGAELDKINDTELAKILRTIDIYARVEPRHKLRIIEAWQREGETVAMTGDGVNDAPALKKADVGVALGSGTDVAKEVSDIVLLDDNFSGIVKAVEQGRAIFENLRKILIYFFSDGFCEVILVSASLLLGLPLPVLAVQILWINFIEHSTPSMALSFEPEEKELMSDKPKRRNSPLLDPEMKVIIFSKAVFTVLALFGLFYYFWKYTDNLAYARTMTFAGLAIYPLFSAWSCKSLRHSIWKKNPFRNKFFNASMVFSFAILISAMYVPFLRDILRVISLGFADWILLVCFGFLNILLIEVVKYFFIARNKKINS